MIYLIGNLEHKICKIGYTENIQKRICAIQTGCPYELSLLGLIEGNRKFETILHKHFEQHQIKNEWFKLVDPIETLFAISAENGEILKPEPAIKIPKKAKKFLYTLVGSEFKVLFGLAYMASTVNQTIILNSSKKAQLANEVGLQVNTLQTTISRLIDKGFFIRTKANCLLLNNKFMIRVDASLTDRELTQYVNLISNLN